MEGASLRIHDPKVSKKQIAIDLGMYSGEFLHSNQVEEFHRNMKWEKLLLNKEFYKELDALVLITDWEEYKKINWADVSSLMCSSGWVFDSRSIVDPKKILENGLNLWRIGDGTLNEEKFKIF